MADDDNPKEFVSADLCAAYRETVNSKIDGLRNTIIVGLSIATTIISILVLATNLLP